MQSIKYNASYQFPTIFPMKNECGTRQINTFKQLYAYRMKKQQRVSIVGNKILNNIDNYITCSKNISFKKIVKEIK